jgi:hypothetical protein
LALIAAILAYLDGSSSFPCPTGVFSIVSENEEKQPVILTVVNAGTPDFPRYLIANQFLQYFTGNGWTDQKSERGALVYRDANDALEMTSSLLLLKHEHLPVKFFRAPLYLQLHTPHEVSMRDLQMWLFRATKLLVDSPRFGNGPVAGSLGICRIEYSELKELPT